MKRSYVIFFLVTSLLFIASTALAVTQTFKQISVEVPSGFTAEEEEEWVYIDDGASRIVNIGVGTKDNKALLDLAKEVYTDMRNSEGYNLGDMLEYRAQNNVLYYCSWDFVYQNIIEGTVIVLDSLLDYRISDNDYCVILMSSEAVNIFSTIYDSINFLNGPSKTHEGDVLVIRIKDNDEGITIGKKQLATMALVGAGCNTGAGMASVIVLVFFVILPLFSRRNSFMRRSFLLIFITALIVVCSASFAHAQRFTSKIGRASCRERV